MRVDQGCSLVEVEVPRLLRMRYVTAYWVKVVWRQKGRQGKNGGEPGEFCCIFCGLWRGE